MSRAKISIGLALLGFVVVLAISRPFARKPPEMLSAPAATDSAPPESAAAENSAQTQNQPQRGMTFEEVYALAGRSMRVVPPPFGPERSEFLKKLFPWPGEVEQIVAGKSGLIIDWKDGKPDFSNFLPSGDQGFEPWDLIVLVLGYQRWEIDGNSQLLSKPIPGDVVFDANATREQLLSGLEDIFQETRGVNVLIKETEMDMPVIVLKGDWKFTPLSGGRSAKQKDGASVVEIFGSDLDPAGGRQSGIFEGEAGRFSLDVSRVFQQEIAIEPSGAPAKMKYHFNYQGIDRPGAPKPSKDLDATLEHICEQTGMVRNTEVRRTKRLVFKDIEPASRGMP